MYSFEMPKKSPQKIIPFPYFVFPVSDILFLSPDVALKFSRKFHRNVGRYFL